MLRPAPWTHARTHALTHTHAHPGPRTRGGAPHPSPPPPPPRPRSPGRLGAFSLFFLIFHLPSPGFPPPRGRRTPLPAGSFRSAGSWRGGGGAPAWLLRPGFSGERRPGPACPRPGCGGAAGREGGQRPSAPAVRAPALPAGRPGAPARPPPPALLPAGRKLTRAPRPTPSWQLPRHPSRSTWACAAPWVPGGSERLEDGVLCRGARAGLAGVAAGRRGAELPVAPGTVRAARVRLPRGFPHFPPAQAPPLGARPRAPRSPSLQEPRGLLWPPEPPPSPSRMEAAAAGAGGEDKSRRKFVSGSRSAEGRDRAGPGGTHGGHPEWLPGPGGVSLSGPRSSQAARPRRWSGAGSAPGAPPGRTRGRSGANRASGGMLTAGGHLGVCGRELDPHGAPKLPCDRTSVPDTLGRPGPGLRVRPQRPAPGRAGAQGPAPGGREAGGLPLPAPHLAVGTQHPWRGGPCKKPGSTEAGQENDLLYSSTDPSISSSGKPYPESLGFLNPPRRVPNPAFHPRGSRVWGGSLEVKRPQAAAAAANIFPGFLNWFLCGLPTLLFPKVSGGTVLRPGCPAVHS